MEKPFIVVNKESSSELKDTFKSAGFDVAVNDNLTPPPTVVNK